MLLFVLSLDFGFMLGKLSNFGSLKRDKCHKNIVLIKNEVKNGI